jgi:hypothetical protein
VERVLLEWRRKEMPDSCKLLVCGVDDEDALFLDSGYEGYEVGIIYIFHLSRMQY